MTQLQAHDTRHRQMQEVNILCMDSGPLRAEHCIVGFSHNTAIYFADRVVPEYTSTRDSPYTDEKAPPIIMCADN